LVDELNNLNLLEILEKIKTKKEAENEIYVFVSKLLNESFYNFISYSDILSKLSKDEIDLNIEDINDIR
jgi:hypothetical protein